MTVSSGRSWRAADLEVDRVVARRDLERARAELRLDELVGDDGHAPLDERHDDLPADGVAVPLVLRVHRDRDVGEHRRGPHGRDRDRAGAVARTGSGRTSSVSSIGSWTTSRSEIAVSWNGHQLTIRFAR